MSGRFLAPGMVVAFGAACLVAPGAARAQSAQAPCQLCSPERDQAADARPETPLRLEVLTRLEFDRIVFAGLGEALVEMSPDGAATMSGATSATGARAMPGSVMVRGEPGRAVRVELPAFVQLYGEGQGAIRIDSIVTDLAAFPRIGDDGTLTFRFGGDLRISGEGDGAYRGSVDILVEYL
ncbi:MAG: DUF4402 domain-containing protein [Pseudomonadota bacterium]|nr:DUF4402 domain-containing protein [Pseudomonadota bacterium]